MNKDKIRYFVFLFQQFIPLWVKKFLCQKIKEEVNKEKLGKRRQKQA
jgi:hypothetical protein